MVTTKPLLGDITLPAVEVPVPVPVPAIPQKKISNIPRAIKKSTGGEGKVRRSMGSFTSKPSEPSDAAASASGRAKRSTVGSWLDGGSRHKQGGDFVTERMTRSKQALMVKPCIERDMRRNCGTVVAMRSSLKSALGNRERRKAIEGAIKAEIDNLEQPGVLRATQYADIPQEYRRDIIGVFMFHTEKYKADGSFDKDKCRIVLLSNLRDHDKIGETYSPTVNPISVLTQLNLAATRKHMVSAYDIKGAFLLTPMQEGVRMFIRVGPEVVGHWLKSYPERKQDVSQDGNLYFELQRYVYGLHEAPREFNGMLDKHIKDMGFRQSTADPCLYMKGEGEDMMVLCVHVDDMLLTCVSREQQVWFEEMMERSYTLVKQYNNVSYLGMSIKSDAGKGVTTVDQKGFVEGLLEKYKCNDLRKYPKTPAAEDLMFEDTDSPICDKTKYLSLIMSLMYAARFTRPDILMVVSYLATKCSNPTDMDMEKAMRVLRYLGGKVNVGLKYQGRFTPTVHADASHLLYMTGQGQQGMIIENGSAPVATRSVKIRMVTRSSSESELVALEDASTYAVWYTGLLHDLGVVMKNPMVITQDNQSCMIMAVQGPTFKRTKHLMGKESYVKERMLKGEVAIRYVPTAEMVADLLTKPMPRAKLEKFLEKLHVVKVCEGKASVKDKGRK
jgi:hypothetical protein